MNQDNVISEAIAFIVRFDELDDQTTAKALDDNKPAYDRLIQLCEEIGAVKEEDGHYIVQYSSIDDIPAQYIEVLKEYDKFDEVNYILSRIGQPKELISEILSDEFNVLSFIPCEEEMPSDNVPVYVRIENPDIVSYEDRISYHPKECIIFARYSDGIWTFEQPIDNLEYRDFIKDGKLIGNCVITNWLEADEDDLEHYEHRYDHHLPYEKYNITIDERFAPEVYKALDLSINILRKIYDSSKDNDTTIFKYSNYLEDLKVAIGVSYGR